MLVTTGAQYWATKFKGTGSPLVIYLGDNPHVEDNGDTLASVKNDNYVTCVTSSVTVTDGSLTIKGVATKASLISASMKYIAYAAVVAGSTLIARVLLPTAKLVSSINNSATITVTLPASTTESTVVTVS